MTTTPGSRVEEDTEAKEGGATPPSYVIYADVPVDSVHLAVWDTEYNAEDHARTLRECGYYAKVTE